MKPVSCIAMGPGPGGVSPPGSSVLTYDATFTDGVVRPTAAVGTARGSGLRERAGRLRRILQAREDVIGRMGSSDDGLLPREFSGGRLRRLRPADLAAFQAYRSIAELGRYQGWSPMSDAEAREFLADMNQARLFEPGQWIQLGIAKTPSDALIGDIGIYLSADGLTGEIGFTLEPGSQGRGLATQAVRQALELFLTRTNVEQVRGVTDSRNEASARLLERLGFRHHETRTVEFRGERCEERVYVRARTGF